MFSPNIYYEKFQVYSEAEGMHSEQPHIHHLDSPMKLCLDLLYHVCLHLSIYYFWYISK